MQEPTPSRRSGRISCFGLGICRKAHWRILTPASRRSRLQTNPDLAVTTGVNEQPQDSGCRLAFRSWRVRVRCQDRSMRSFHCVCSSSDERSDASRWLADFGQDDSVFRSQARSVTARIFEDEGRENRGSRSLSMRHSALTPDDVHALDAIGIWRLLQGCAHLLMTLHLASTNGYCSTTAGQSSGLRA